MTFDLRQVRSLLPRGMASLTGSNAASMLCSLAAMPLVARWYAVSDLGVYQIYVTTMAVASMVSCARFDYAILLPSDDTTARRLCLLATLTALGIGALAALAMPAASAILNTAGWRALGDHAVIVGVIIAVTGMSAAMTQWCVRTGRFHTIARARVAQSLVTAVLQVAGAFAGMGGIALILGDGAGRLINLAALSFRRRMSSAAGWPLAITDLPGLARNYIRFPTISTPSALINAAGFSLPIFLLERFYGTRVVGIYSLLDRVLGMPSALAGLPLSQIFTHRFRAAAKQGPVSAVKEIHATIRLAALLGLVPFALLAIAGSQLFTIVFGAKWQEAGYLAQVVALPYFVAHVFSPSMPALLVLDRLRTQLLWDIGRVVFMISCLWAMANIGAGPNLLILTIPSVMAGMYCLHCYLCVRAARRL